MSPGNDSADLGRQILKSMAMLAKSVRIYSTDNAIFLKPLQSLLELLNRVVALSQRVEIEIDATALKINGAPVALDHGGQDALTGLAHALEAHQIAGFTSAGPIPLEDLRNFFALLAAGSKGPIPADGLPGHQLQQLRLRRPAAVAAPATGPDAAAPGPTSREELRRRALAAYARAALWADAQLRCLHERRPEDEMAACPRLAQDLVDASGPLPGGLLPALVNGEGARAISFHLANTAAIAVAFAQGIGLARPRIRDLAVAALSCEAALIRLPPELWMPADPDRLPPEHQQLRAAAWAEESVRILGKKSAGPLDQLRALAVEQMHQSHLVPITDAAGATAWQLRGDPLFASRVLAIAAHYDALTAPAPDHPAYSQDQALVAMWGPLRQRFDAELLWVFARLMAPIPLKACARAAGGLLD